MNKFGKKLSLTSEIGGYCSLSGIFCVHYLLFLQWRGKCGWNNINILNRHILKVFLSKILKSVHNTGVYPKVQTEIRKTWLRWTLAFDWKVPVVLANYRYGSVLNSSVQSQLTSVTRSSALLTSRVYRCAGRTSVSTHASHIHTTLPGYVFSSSDIESLPPSIPEEIDEEAKHIDDITLKESAKRVNGISVRREALSICFEESGQSTTHVDSDDIITRDDDATPKEIAKRTDDITRKDSLYVRYYSLDQEDEEVL